MQSKRGRVSRDRENSGNDYFSDLILSDLIKEGFTGGELLLKFRETHAEYRGAVRSLAAESGEAARNYKRTALDETEELFGAVSDD